MHLSRHKKLASSNSIEQTLSWSSSTSSFRSITNVLTKKCSSSRLSLPLVSSKAVAENDPLRSVRCEPSSILTTPPPLLCEYKSGDLGTVQDLLPFLSAKQLADAVWGFASESVRPSTDVMHAITQEILTKLSAFSCQDLSNTAWAFAVLQYRPYQDFWVEFERQVYKNLTDFSEKELSNLMWSFAHLNHRPAWILDSVLAQSADNFCEYCPNSLHLIIWSLGKLEHQPPQEWLHQFLRSAQINFFQFTPSEMANTIWALARLGNKPPKLWLDNFLLVAQWRFPSFEPRLLSTLIWSVAVLEHKPSQEWLLCFEEQVRDRFDRFSGHELACVAWSLRKFGCKKENNMVFYLLEKQDRFLEADFDMLANSKLLSQVLSWREGHSMGPHS